MFKSLLNLFNQTESENNINKSDEEIALIAGIMVEVADIDGKIDKNEIDSISNALSGIFKENQSKTDIILNNCLKNAKESKSLYYFTSKINKEFEVEKKINLLEILWEIILADGQIHDFESNIIRRLAGLLYISDVDCGNAKKRALSKIDRFN